MSAGASTESAGLPSPLLPSPADPSTAPSHEGRFYWLKAGLQDRLECRAPLFDAADLDAFEAYKARSASPTEAAEWSDIIDKVRQYLAGEARGALLSACRAPLLTPAGASPSPAGAPS